MARENYMKFKTQCPYVRSFLELIHLRTVYGCFSATSAEVSSCGQRPYGPQKQKYVLIWPFTQKFYQPLTYKMRMNEEKSCTLLPLKLYLNNKTMKELRCLKGVVSRFHDLVFTSSCLCTTEYNVY